MTAEIVIMNKEAVALAADSAATSFLAGGHKIFTSADKIFRLSNSNPVGIMFYNNANLIGIPWDTILKTYRKHLQQKRYDKLEDYVIDFVYFLEKNNPIITEKMQKEYLRNIALGYFLSITEEIENVANETIKEKGLIDEKTIESIVLEVISKHIDTWVGQKRVVKGSYSKNTCKKIVSNNKEIIDRAITVAFENLPISKARKRLFEIIEGLLYTGTSERMSAGVVIAGFGNREAFPTFSHMVVDGMFDNKLKYSRINKTIIGEDTDAAIAAFAQGEMVARFMEGVDPIYKEIEKGYLSQIPEKFTEHFLKKLKKYNKGEKEKLKDRLVAECDKIIDDFHKNMINSCQKDFYGPIINVVSVLPKSDLATLAESLISLTVVKRKFSPESETVAEPIDVALISKGDGFIWIKRKHYFNPELNPGFFERRYKELENVEKG